MPFAEINAQAWGAILSAIIAAVFLGLTTLIVQVVGLWLAYRRDRDKIARDAEAERERIAREDKKEAEKLQRDQAVAAKVAKVAEVQAVQAKEQGDKLDGLAEGIGVVHKATNSIVKQLVEKAGEAGKLTGAADERAKSDAKTEAAATHTVPDAAANESLKTSMDKLPDRTAAKVVEKLKDEETPP